MRDAVPEFTIKYFASSHKEKVIRVAQVLFLESIFRACNGKNGSDPFYHVCNLISFMMNEFWPCQIMEAVKR